MPTDDPRDDQSQVFIADPGDADIFDDEPMPPRWTRVVGTVSVVLGGLGVICNGLGIVGSIFTAQLMGAAADELPPAMVSPSATAFVMQGASALVSILLIVAGSLCLLQKPATRPLHLAYALAGIAATIVAVLYQLDVQDQIAQWVQDNPNTDFAQQYRQGGGSMGSVFGMACTVLIGLPWPAFCLFWFGLVKTRPEQYTGGVEAPAA